MMVSPGRTRVSGGTDLRATPAGDRPVDADVPAIGARREAAGDRDRVLDRHVRHVGVLAGHRHLAQDEERPIDLDLDRDMRLADEAAAQPFGDRAREFVGRQAARRHGLDQRHGDRAARIDDVGIGEPVLPEHDDAQRVAGIERVGRLALERRDDWLGVCRQAPPSPAHARSPVPRRRPVRPAPGRGRAHGIARP